MQSHDLDSYPLATACSVLFSVNLYLFSQLMTAAANVKLTHPERDFGLFAGGFFLKKKNEISGERKEVSPFF